MFLGRIGSLLESLQDPEQGGPDHSCSEMVHFMRMVAEKSEEWGQKVWAASLDLEKAFDEVVHSSVLSALMEAGGRLRRGSILVELLQATTCICLPSKQL